MTARRSRATAVAAVAAVALGALGALAACSRTDPLPPEEKEAINLGTNAEVGAISVDNLLLVTRGEGRPARLLGLLTNESNDPVEVVLTDADDSIAVTVPGARDYSFEEHPTLFATADQIPGALASVTVATADDSETVTVPIRDGSLDWLRPYVPES